MSRTVRASGDAGPAMLEVVGEVADASLTFTGRRAHFTNLGFRGE